jgi:C4-dicarboxylate-specific signal transduction histidine kinase
MTNPLQKGRTLALTVVLFLCLCQGIACSEEAWRASFDETCSKTTEAMTLSVGELTGLLERCAVLQKIIESQEESVRKVYLKRLQLCRNLYAYVLDYKKGGGATSESSR